MHLIGSWKSSPFQDIAKDISGFLDRRHRVLFGGDAIQGAVYLGIDGLPALCPTYLYPDTYLLTNQFIEHLDIDLYVSCHWPLKKGNEIAEFCRRLGKFVERAEILVRSARKHTTWVNYVIS